MKTTLSLLAFSLLFSVSYAQDRPTLRDIKPISIEIIREGIIKDTPSPKEDVVEKNNNLRERIERKKGEIRTERKKLENESKDRILGIVRGMSNKFNEAIDKIENIEIRIIEIKEKLSIDINIEEAIRLKELAKSSVEESIEIIKEEINNEEGISKEIITETLLETQTDIKNAWEAYREVFIEIKNHSIDSEE